MVMDVFTKWVEAFPLCDTVAITLARVLVKEVICHYGVPDSIHSDQGLILAVKYYRPLSAYLALIAPVQ